MLELSEVINVKGNCCGENSLSFFWFNVLLSRALVARVSVINLLGGTYLNMNVVA